MRAILFIAAAVAAATFAFPAAASKGGVNAAGCHVEKKTGDAHYHHKGTRKKAGDCVPRDGKLVPAPKLLTVPEASYRAMIESNRRLRIELRERVDETEALRRQARTLSTQLSVNTRSLRASERAVRDARREADNARRDAAAAEARARGKGPAVSPRCVRGVHAALDSGWRFDSGEKAALRRACLDN